MNYLTQSNAPAYVGRHISCSRPRFHYINTPEEIAEHCRAAARGREAI